MAISTRKSSGGPITSSSRQVLVFLWMLVALNHHLLPQSVLVSAIPIQLYGLNYNTRKGPDWAWDKCKAYHEIRKDLDILKRVTTRIRLLSLTDCQQADLLEVVHELDMQVWMGMWVAPEAEVWDRELAELRRLLDLRALRTSPDDDTVLGITVGSEAIYRGDATVEEMIEHMEEVRELLAEYGMDDMAVTICDIAPVYAMSPQLRSAVDVIYTNTFPFWEGIDIDLAVEDLQEDLEWVIDLPESRSKPFVLGETGWPSAGFISGVGVASPQNQQQYFIEAFCRLERNRWSYYWFTGIDNAWRQIQDPNNTIEGNWGFMYANLTLKSHFQDLEFTCDHDGVLHSFREVDWSIPDFTAAPSSLDLSMCQHHSQCEGLGGWCCPARNGMYLDCCDRDIVPPPNAAPLPSTLRPGAPPTESPTTNAPILDPVDLTTPDPSSGPTLDTTELLSIPPIDPVQTTGSPTLPPTVQTRPPTVSPTLHPSPTPTASPTMIPTQRPASFSSDPTVFAQTPSTPIREAEEPSDPGTVEPFEDFLDSLGNSTNETSFEPTLAPTSQSVQSSAPTPKPTVSVVFRPSSNSNAGGNGTVSNSNSNLVGSSAGTSRACGAEVFLLALLSFHLLC